MRPLLQPPRAFTAARNLAPQAQVRTDREREDILAIYPAAQALAVDLCDTIEFFYRQDPASRRAKCKRWGVVYFYAPNEPQDPEPTPAPAPPANPPQG